MQVFDYFVATSYFVIIKSNSCRKKWCIMYRLLFFFYLFSFNKINCLRRNCTWLLSKVEIKFIKKKKEPKTYSWKSQEESSFSNKPNARTAQADPATTTAAKTGGTSKSILDLLNRWAGRQSISPGRSNGTLTATDASPAAPSHSFENEEEGDIDQTNVTSGQNDAAATVAVRRAVHAAA